jgi:CTP:molybdopterin cytidylyltransferase MocA/carbon monoxide dehydrogenase subunit G
MAREAYRGRWWPAAGADSLAAPWGARGGDDVLIENEFEVPAPLERTWAYLLDVEKVAPCAPGAELTETLDERTWKGKLSLKLGPVSLAFAGTVSIRDRDDAGHRLVLAARGQETRGKGAASATVTARLEERGSNAFVRIESDITLTGTVAQLSRGLLPDVSRRLTAQFAECLRSSMIEQGRDASAVTSAGTPVVAAVVLAAGSASRFGGTKQLALLDGKPLVRHAVQAAREAGIADVVVVVGHDAEAVASAAGTDASIVANPRHAEGQSTSLVAGLDALGDDVDAAVILLADQPGITTEMIRDLVETASSRREPIVRLRFVDGPGPALLRRSVWDDVRTLEGDTGARELVERRPNLMFEAFVATAAPSDVDTPADLDRVRDGRRAGGPGDEKPPSF